MSHKIAESVEELVGSTPLLRLSKAVQNIPAGGWLRKEKSFEKTFTLHGDILAKVEFMNPGGSVKDRIAVHMVNRAEQRGDLKKGATIVEATSGNVRWKAVSKTATCAASGMSRRACAIAATAGAL